MQGTAVKRQEVSPPSLSFPEPEGAGQYKQLFKKPVFSPGKQTVLAGFVKKGILQKTKQGYLILDMEALRSLAR